MIVRKDSFFTLIELMVVVSIISILAALLLPALSMAKQKGQEMLCRGNLRQMYLAAITYSSDNNDWCLSGTLSPSTIYWQQGLSTLNYISAKNVFKCPGENIFAMVKERMNYGINHYTFGAGPTSATVPPQRLQNVTKFGVDSSLIFFIDTPPVDYAGEGIGFISDASYLCKKYIVYPINSSGQNYPAYARHNRRANAAIFDGHVESLGFQDLTARTHWNPTQLTPGILVMN